LTGFVSNRSDVKEEFYSLTTVIRGYTSQDPEKLGSQQKNFIPY
jgi:hypothetical protein